MIWTDWFQSWFYFLCHSHNNNSITTGRFEQLTKGRRQKQELGTTTKLRTSLGATARRQRSKMKTELWRTFIERVVNEFISHWVLLFLGIQYMTEILDCYHNTDSTFHVNLRCWRTSKNFGEPLTEPAWTSWLRRQTFLMWPCVVTFIVTATLFCVVVGHRRVHVVEKLVFTWWWALGKGKGFKILDCKYLLQNLSIS